MRGSLTEFAGINACIHAASSTILMESNKMKLQQALGELAARPRPSAPGGGKRRFALTWLPRLVDSVQRRELLREEKPAIVCRPVRVAAGAP